MINTGICWVSDRLGRDLLSRDAESVYFSKGDESSSSSSIEEAITIHCNKGPLLSIVSHACIYAKLQCGMIKLSANSG